MIENNTIVLLSIIILIIIITIFVILYTKKTIENPFNYIVQQIENNQPIDTSYLYKNFEYEKISSLYESLRKLQLSIEEKNLQLEANNKEFILSSIHQLKTPLGAISMNLELLEMVKVDENQKEFIEQIKSAVDTLNINAEELAYLSMKDEIVYTKENINLSSVLNQRVEYFKSIVNANDRNINLIKNDDIFYEINANEFERLIDNNISNAIKYSNVNSIIDISLKKDDNKIVLQFQNNGKNIKEPSRLFEKGYRESDNRDGYGLGLYIIKSICDKYDIKIEVISKNNQNIFRYVI